MAWASWGNWGSCCCGGSILLCVGVCSPSGPLVGAVITVTGVGSCTTVAGGCCTIPGLTPGTYTVTVTYGGSTIYGPTSRVITAGTNSITVPSPPNINCCTTAAGVACGIPFNLHLTDTNGTIAFTWDAVALKWKGCYTFNPGITIITATGAGTLCATDATLGTGSIAIFYEGVCNNSFGTGGFTVTQRWATYFSQLESGEQVMCGTFSGTAWTCVPCSHPPFYYFLSTCASTSAIINQSSVVTADWTSCSPFAWSGSFPSSIGSGQATFTAPVSGTVSISP